MPIVFCSLIQLFFSFRACITTWHLRTCLLSPPTPTPSRWKLPESGVYTSLIHPQCPEQGLAHSRCLIHLFLEWTCEEMNEWMSEYLLRAGSEDMILRKNRSACCPHEVYDLVGQGIMKEIITKQRSNFDPDKQWCQDVKDKESMRSRGERSCTGINTRAEVTRRARERGGKEQREVIKAWAENVWGKGCEREVGPW